jgi:hypothetical protein
MKYFLDTEFHEDGKKIDLISVAIVNDMGRHLCLTSSEFDLKAAKAKPWLVENVLCQLPPQDLWVTRAVLRDSILKFIGNDRKPQFWAWYADYDWVALCQLFGTMMDLPKGWPMFCLDLKQEHFLAGSPVLPKQDAGLHDALEDAKWNQTVYEILMGK